MTDYLKFVTIAVFLFTVYTIIKRSSYSLDEEVRQTVRKFYYTWNRCITHQISLVRQDHQALWDKIGEASGRCDNYTGINQFQIIEYPNMDESKFSISPSNPNDLSVIVTIGIGRDVTAEQKIKQDLGNNSLFFGADPIVSKNDKLFEPIGQFFPFAVSGKSGLSKASVLDDGGYKQMDMIHVDLVYFLHEIIEPTLTLFDNIWIDAEGGEYSMMPLFHRGGRLDQYNITICQFNMEVHQPGELQKKQFRDFIDQTLIDERYAFLKLSTAAGHWRMYFINMDNNECSKKYLVKITD